MSLGSLTEIREGAARLLIPGLASHGRGPGTRGEGVFYNPAMALSRDVSLCVYRAALPDGARVLDGLAASGARAVRLALSGGLDHAVPPHGESSREPRLDVAANDRDGDAAALVGQNAERNGVKVEVHRRDLSALLWETRWHGIDVDPFGSPSVFVDAAARSVLAGGVLALAATDTTALFGVYPDVCRRRYLATPLRCEIGHEIALRILAGFAARQAAKHDVALAPVLAHATDHYYRIYLRARPGAGRADRALAEIGYATLCACGERGLSSAAPAVCDHCGAVPRSAGPLWIGSLFDEHVARGARGRGANERLAKPDATAALLASIEEEAVAPPLYVDIHHAAARAKTDPPRFDRLLPALRERGFRAARTHMRQTAIRTDAGERELREVLREIGRRAAPARDA
ncbi:MAG TPA: hypothetical protein VI997_01405 [Candidatus Thermoplasmatota archaeon]|nr:hypothetical protein [Candidatus Thermoplasmatota archaeon]